LSLDLNSVTSVKNPKIQLVNVKKSISHGTGFFASEGDSSKIHIEAKTTKTAKSVFTAFEIAQILFLISPIISKTNPIKLATTPVTIIDSTSIIADKKETGIVTINKIEIPIINLLFTKSLESVSSNSSSNSLVTEMAIGCFL
jgi:hypothetical protein